jgi:hypothetical protein
MYLNKIEYQKRYLIYKDFKFSEKLTWESNLLQSIFQIKGIVYFERK